MLTFNLSLLCTPKAFRPLSYFPQFSQRRSFHISSTIMSQEQLKSRKRSDYGFIQEYRTRWMDNDMYDHVNNSVYYYFFDSVVNSYLIEHCKLHPPTSSQIGLVVHSHCDYFGPVAFPSVLDVAMRVKKLGKSSVAYETAVFEKGVEEVKAVGEFVHVYVDAQTRKPSPSGMNADMRTALGRLVETQAKL